MTFMWITIIKLNNGLFSISRSQTEAFGSTRMLHMPAAKYVYVDAKLALLTLLLFGCTQTLYESYGFAWLCVSFGTVARSCHNVPYQEIMVLIHDAHLGSEQIHSIGISYVLPHAQNHGLKFHQCSYYELTFILSPNSTAWNWFVGRK